MFYKVDQKGCTYIVATFFNPDTNEVQTECVRDYNDDRAGNDELYRMSIDENARAMWIHHNGGILIGDTVKVVKGRNVPIGTVAKVVGEKHITDCYDRFVAHYVILDNGKATNVTNCELIVEGV